MGLGKVLKKGLSLGRKVAGASMGAAARAAKPATDLGTVAGVLYGKAKKKKR